jgi:hypothetical protein
MQAHARISGYPVVGDFRRLLAMIDAGEVECVVLNTRVADVEKLQQLDQACREREVELVKLQLNLKPFTVAS